MFIVHTHCYCISLEEIEEPQPTQVTVKLSGDGASIITSSTMVFLTFSFPGLAENVLSAAYIVIPVRDTCPHPHI